MLFTGEVAGSGKATIQLKLTGPASTTVTLKGTDQFKLQGLPVGSCKARMTLSAGL